MGNINISNDEWNRPEIMINQWLMGYDRGQTIKQSYALTLVKCSIGAFWLITLKIKLVT